MTEDLETLKGIKDKVIGLLFIASPFIIPILIFGKEAIESIKATLEFFLALFMAIIFVVCILYGIDRILR